MWQSILFKSGLLQHEPTFYCSSSYDFQIKTVQGKKTTFSVWKCTQNNIIVLMLRRNSSNFKLGAFYFQELTIKAAFALLEMQKPCQVHQGTEAKLLSTWPGQLQRVHYSCLFNFWPFYWNKDATQCQLRWWFWDGCFPTVNWITSTGLFHVLNSCCREKKNKI